MQTPQPVRHDGPARFAPSEAARVLSLLYLLAVVLFVIHVSWDALSAHYTVPNKDDWRILDDMFSKPVVEWILTHQNGHWVSTTLGLLYVDYMLLGGRMHLLAVVSVFSLAAGLGTLVFLLLAPRRRPRDPLRLATLGFAGFLFAWGAARHDLVWGLQGSVVLAAMWTLVSLASFGVWLEGRHESGVPSGPKLLGVSAIAATAATFSQGIGFSCWGGLLLVAIAARVPLRVLALLASCTLGALLLYRSGIESIPGRGSMEILRGLGLSAPIFVMDRALAFIGSPVVDVLTSSGVVTRGPRYELARICGAVGCAIFALTGLRMASRRTRLTRRHVLAIGLPTAALAGGAIVALNRAGFVAASTHIRFATWSSLFWVGLAVAIPTLADGRRGAWAGLAWVVSAALLSGLALPALEDARAHQASRRDQLAVLRTMHQLDIRWDGAAGGRTIVKWPDRSYRVVDRFRRDGTSFFREPPALLPRSRLSDHATLGARGRCDGNVTSAHRISGRTGPALLVSGWGVERPRGAPIEQVVLTNKDGVIVGMGVPVSRTTRLIEVSLPDQDFPWTGFIRGNFGRGPYSAFGLLDEGRVACRLGTVTRPLSNPKQPDPRRTKPGRPGQQPGDK